MIRTAQKFFGDINSVVMNPSQNPLNVLPPVQRFQIMSILSIMWSTIFCSVVGAWFVYSELVVGHVLVLLGIFITAGVFKSAQPTPKAKLAFLQRK